MTRYEKLHKVLVMEEKTRLVYHRIQICCLFTYPQAIQYVGDIFLEQ